MNKQGKIIKQKSNLYTVLSEGETYECRARGKFRNDFLTPLVGEFVVFDDETNYILELLERKNSLKRPSIANVDAALIVTSVKEPNLSLTLLDRELACISNENIEPVICLTKTDLLSSKERKQINKIFAYHKKIGFKVVTNKHLFRLKRIIKDKTVVLTGQTGAGKSTLINNLDKKLNLETKEISKALGRGVHTTRHTELFKIGGAYIADTPGFSSLDLTMRKNKLKELYPEFRFARCKYGDCNHIKESGCMVKELVELGRINKNRYENYVKFWGEL